MNNSFYKTPKWRKKRAAVMRRDEYLCQEAKRYGKSIPATMVHHILPYELYPEYALCDWNLVSLSDKWHNAMHIRDSHELTELGKQWQERVRHKREAWDRGGRKQWSMSASGESSGKAGFSGG